MLVLELPKQNSIQISENKFTMKQFLILFVALCSLTCTKKIDLNNPIDSNTKLLPPTEVTATASADTLVTVMWKDANTYPENTVVTYLIETDTTSGTFAQIGTSLKGTIEAKLLLPLRIGRQYVFRVRIQADKKYSDYSEQKTIQIQFTDPTNVTLTVEADTAVVVNWQYTGTFQTGFEIERQIGSGAFVNIGYTTSSTLTFKDTVALIVGQYYIYRVRAISKNNMSSYSINSSLTASFIDPTNITIAQQADTAVVVNWSYTGSFQTGFEIERQIGNSGFIKVGMGKSTDRNYNDAIVLTIGQQYTYRVRALSKNNVSGFGTSAILTATFIAPINVSLTAQADTAVVVNWQYTGTFQTGFEIERQIGSGNFIKVGTIVANVLTFKDKLTLFDGQQYSYRIRAITKNSISAYTPISILSYLFLPPNNLSISMINETSISLTWTNANDFSKIIIIEKSNNGIEYFVIDSLSSPLSTSKTITGVFSSDTTYSFRLRAKSNFNSSGYSNSVSQKLVFPEPNNLRITSMTTSQVSLSWTDNSSFETGFEIEQSTNGGSYSLIQSVGANLTTATITATFDQTITYSFRLCAVTKINRTKYSSPTSYNIVKAAGIVFVTGGTFTMGSPTDPLNTEEQPQHSVILSDYFVSNTEIRWGTWDSVYQWGKNNGYTDLPVGVKGYPTGDVQHPVTTVNWYDVVKWCNARSEKEGLTPVYYINTDFSAGNIYKTGNVDLQNTMVNWSANGYRLPTEAEWEYAAQGGINRHNPHYRYSGSDFLPNVGYYDENSGHNTHSVGSLQPNELGIYDMSGNVWEWCWDWYGKYSSTTQTNPYGPSSGASRLRRGASIGEFVGPHHVAGRGGSNSPDSRNGYCGFRCVRTK